MAYTLLGAHVNAVVSGLPEALGHWQPPLVVALDHGDVWHSVKTASPSTVFVGRVVQAAEPDFNSPALDPQQAARMHCDRILPWAERMGETYSFWQGVNEPVIHSPQAMARCAEFDAERARLMARHGFRVVVGSFSVGNPTKLAYWREFLPALEAARQFDGALALHEYSWPELKRQSPWYLLRHRKVYDGEPDHGWPGLPPHLRRLPLLITECGLDGLITQGDRPRGWQVLHGQDPTPYLHQLAWYDAELQKDSYVVGAALFCCAAHGGDWATYNIWPEVVAALAREAAPTYRFERFPLPDWIDVPALAFRPQPRLFPGTGPGSGAEARESPTSRPDSTLERAVPPSIRHLGVQDGRSSWPPASEVGPSLAAPPRSDLPTEPRGSHAASALPGASATYEQVMERLDRIIARLREIRSPEGAASGGRRRS